MTRNEAGPASIQSVERTQSLFFPLRRTICGYMLIIRDVIAPIEPWQLDREPGTILGGHFGSGHVRRIWPGDAASYCAHLIRLDGESRNMRFAGAISDESICDYAGLIADPCRVLHGFFDGNELRGASELVPPRHGEYTAEAAFSVEKGYRRRGVGQELMARSIRAARTRDIRQVMMRCLATNHAMQTLARKFGAELIFGNGDVLALIDPPPATRATFADEAIDGLRDLALAWCE
jgi:GNAT superfamily N-acetyltransferase